MNQVRPLLEKESGQGGGVAMAYRHMLRGRRSRVAGRSLQQLSRHAVQHVIVAFDIVAFGDPARDDQLQLHLRRSLYQILERSFVDSGLPWREQDREDSGDGLSVIVPAGIPTGALIDPLVAHLRAGLRRHNRTASDPAKIRLRMALHTGHVYRDPNGFTGRSLITLFRLLDAPEFKHVFTAAAADLALITSDEVYQDVIRHGPGLIDPDAYRPIEARSKETCVRAWVQAPLT
jgi:hypothetical protein